MGWNSRRSGSPLIFVVRNCSIPVAKTAGSGTDLFEPPCALTNLLAVLVRTQDSDERFVTALPVRSAWGRRLLLLCAVLFDVVFSGFLGMMVGFELMSVSHVRMMPRRFVITFLMVIRSRAMMLRGMLQMLRGLAMMVCCFFRHGISSVESESCARVQINPTRY